MKRGVLYQVSCRQLGLPEEQWTEQGSYRQANDWWEKKLSEIYGNHHSQKIKDIQIAAVDRLWAGGEPRAVANDMIEQIMGKERCDAIRANAVARFEAFTAEPAAPSTIGDKVDEFLGIMATNTKPKTYAEVRGFLLHIKPWLIGDIDETKVKEVYRRITEATQWGDSARKKRWGFFRRFVNWLAEDGTITAPGNLHSKFFKFRVSDKTIETWTHAEVRAALAGLPDRLRLYALLGLQCGCTQVDVANLTHGMVKDGYLTRQRHKTQDKGTPTVSYRLWPETLELLERFKSPEDAEWLLTSSTGTKLVESRIENGQLKEKDLIGKAWAETDCPIPLRKFRSVGAAALTDSKWAGHTVHFLGHSAKSIQDKHYAPYSQRLFDSALTWLRTKFFE